MTKTPEERSNPVTTTIEPFTLAARTGDEQWAASRADYASHGYGDEPDESDEMFWRDGYRRGVATGVASITTAAKPVEDELPAIVTTLVGRLAGATVALDAVRAQHPRGATSYPPGEGMVTTEDDAIDEGCMSCQVPWPCTTMAAIDPAGARQRRSAGHDGLRPTAELLISLYADAMTRPDESLIFRGAALAAAAGDTDDAQAIADTAEVIWTHLGPRPADGPDRETWAGEATLLMTHTLVAM